MTKMISKIVLILIFFIISLFALFGCTRVEYKPVPVPVKCEVALKERPTASSYGAHYLKSVLEYSDELECDLHFCVTGEVKKNCKVNKKEKQQ